MEKQSNIWDAITNVFTSANAIPVLVVLTIITIAFLVMTRKGMITLHTKNVDIGIADRERDVLRQQCEWLRNHYKSHISNLPRGDNFDVYRAKYILERAQDMAQEWVLFNHMSVSNAYISVKQDSMVGLIQSITDEDVYHTPEFIEYIRKDTDTVIRTCVAIRKEYR